MSWGTLTSTRLNCVCDVRMNTPTALLDPCLNSRDDKEEAAEAEDEREPDRVGCQGANLVHRSHTALAAGRAWGNDSARHARSTGCPHVSTRALCGLGFGGGRGARSGEGEPLLHR